MFPLKWQCWNGAVKLFLDNVLKHAFLQSKQKQIIQLSEYPEAKKFSFLSTSSLELLLPTKKLEGDFHCKSLWKKKKKENIDFA